MPTMNPHFLLVCGNCFCNFINFKWLLISGALMTCLWNQANSIKKAILKKVNCGIISNNYITLSKKNLLSFPTCKIIQAMKNPKKRKNMQKSLNNTL
jgi:hypothetical protein